MTRLDDYLLEADQRGRRFSGAYTGTSGTLAGYVVTLVKLVRALLGQGVSKSQREELIRMGMKFDEFRDVGPSGPPGYWEIGADGNGRQAISREAWLEAQRVQPKAAAESPAIATAPDINPKDAAGASKLPMHLWPAVATAEGCVALLNGQLKYGRNNFRVTSVRATIYADALSRHMARWMDGEECDEDGISHLGSALACLAILVDARAAGKLEDDRNVPGGVAARFAELTPLVAELRARSQADRPHRDWTISDAPRVG